MVSVQYGDSRVQTSHNPYAKALDGLHLENPVEAFFDFCRERERIRILRESGAPAPWSEDPIFQQGRFLNVFREAAKMDSKRGDWSWQESA